MKSILSHEEGIKHKTLKQTLLLIVLITNKKQLFEYRIFNLFKILLLKLYPQKYVLFLNSVWLYSKNLPKYIDIQLHPCSLQINSLIHQNKSFGSKYLKIEINQKVYQQILHFNRQFSSRIRNINFYNIFTINILENSSLFCALNC